MVPVAANRKAALCGVFVVPEKPSDGLEPSTPSLPWRIWTLDIVPPIRVHRALSPANSVVQPRGDPFRSTP
jgi:hypothetical protein